MTTTNDIRSLIRAWPFLFFAGLLGMVLALGFSFGMPLQYSSTVRVLITQNNVSGVDPYTAIKSTERIASSLAQLVYTSTFTNQVLSETPTFNKNYFPNDEVKKRKAWQKTIETGVAPGTGIMSIVVYHASRAQARILVAAIAHELASQAPNYFGYNVRVQEIDSPLDSEWIAKPRFVRNGVFGFFVGFLAGMAWVLVRMGKRRI